MPTVLHLTFGFPDNAVAWFKDMPDDWVPVLGEAEQFDFRPLPGGPDSVGWMPQNGHIAFIDVQEDGTTVAVAYGGPVLPDAGQEHVLDAGSWSRHGDENAGDLTNIAITSPLTAVAHNVTLVVGDLLDEAGESQVQIWNRCVCPTEPAIPIFAQRFFVMLTDSAEVYGYDHAVNPVDQSRVEIDLSIPGTVATGLPGIVAYAALTGPGFGHVILWVPTFGDVDAVDLLAAGWQQITPEYMNTNGDVLIAERTRLALRTRLVFQEHPNGEVSLDEFFIDDAASVPASSYVLLPPWAAAQCEFAAALDEDDLIGRWMADG